MDKIKEDVMKGNSFLKYGRMGKVLNGEKSTLIDNRIV